MARKSSESRARTRTGRDERRARRGAADNRSRAASGRPPAKPRPIITARCATRCWRRPSGCSSATGWPGLTLRAVAREAGVSHAAPTHHFGDLTGLVSELAAIGFRQFNAAMAAGRLQPARCRRTRRMARAKAYVAYAQAHPGMYGLMFRTERLDMTRPSLHEAANASFAGLGRRDRRQPPRADFRSRRCRSTRPPRIARAWSLVHGFTMLLLDDRLSDVLRRLPEGTDAETLLEAMLKSTIGRPPGVVTVPHIAAMGTAAPVRAYASLGKVAVKMREKPDIGAELF